MTLVDKGRYGNLIKIDEKQTAIKKALGLPALLSKKTPRGVFVCVFLIALLCLLGSSRYEQQGSSARGPM